MERAGRVRTEVRYFSGRLKRKMDEIQFACTTIVEAPSGYGKTTAVRDYLESKSLAGTPVHWFSATEEAPSSSFSRLCLEIAKVDEEAGHRLLRIDLPNAVTIGEVCDALRSLRCRHETYLVVDNYHLLQGALPPSFLLALIEHGGENLHVVVVTQMLSRDNRAITAGRGFLSITATDLRLNAADIERYYSLAGVSISPEEAVQIERYTEGWIIAVYLQLCAYSESGTFSLTPGIMALMERLVWDALSPDQQTFLLRMSPFEVFTLQQACYLLGCQALPEYTEAALASPFISYGRAEGRYEMHSILSRLLSEKRKARGQVFSRECLTRAGDWCRDNGRTAEALDYYWQTKDYERILSLDFSPVMLEEVGGTPFPGVASGIARDCPAKVKRSNMLSMLRIAWTLLLAGMDEAFDSLMEELGGFLGVNTADLDAAGSGGTVSHSDARLLGEWVLLMSFREYPHLPKMTERLRMAASLFPGRTSQVIQPFTPWWFGSLSPLAVFHVIPGEADREADDLEQYIALYSRLTNGHGSGADALYRAELAYQRGDLTGAEVHAYKASFLAGSRQQSTVQLAAAIILAQAALQKADTAGWQHALNSMERAMSYPLQNTSVVRSALDAARGVLLVELQVMDAVAEWLRRGDSSGRVVPAALMDTVVFVHLMYLLYRGENAQVVGRAEARFLEGWNGHVFSDVIGRLILAVGCFRMGDPARARQAIEEAVQVAAPDGLITALASYSWLLEGMPDEIIARAYPHLSDRLSSLKQRFGRGWQSLHETLLPDESSGGLTPREMEVAKLAAQGLRNAEIAASLVVSEATVRAHLRSIFQKLDIDRRARLAERLK
jgi:LuxR family maltose regulon positive regulatory protein